MHDEKNKQQRAKKGLFKTISKMVPAVGTALIATALGFVALYTSPVPMIQDFGKMLTIGIIVSFILGIFLLIPLLFSRDSFFTIDHVNKQGNEKKKRKKPSRLLSRLTDTIISLRWVIIVVAFTAAAIGIWLDVDAGVETDVETFMPQDTQALKDIHKLRDIVGTTDQISIVYEGEDMTSYKTITWLDDVTGAIEEEFPDVVVETKSLSSMLRLMNDHKLPNEEDVDDFMADIPEEQLKMFMNEEGKKGVITVGMKHLETERLQDFITDLDQFLQRESLDRMTTSITGKAVLDVEMIEGLSSGRYQMTLLGMGLVFLGLLVIYRHPVKAFIPLLPIILIVGWSGLAMYFLEMDYTPLTATLGALIIGIGTEFTVLIMERYFEEREKGRGANVAIRVANQKIGQAIVVSALTTIGGFCALLASDFVILNNFGLMTLINITFALFSTIVVMPAILILFDRFVKIKHTS
ncbi:MAG TPA: MMPL family transporter [Bacillota bacterium]